MPQITLIAQTGSSPAGSRHLSLPGSATSGPTPRSSRIPLAVAREYPHGAFAGHVPNAPGGSAAKVDVTCAGNRKNAPGPWPVRLRRAPGDGTGRPADGASQESRAAARTGDEIIGPGHPAAWAALGAADRARRRPGADGRLPAVRDSGRWPRWARAAGRGPVAAGPARIVRGRRGLRPGLLRPPAVLGGERGLVRVGGPRRSAKRSSSRCSRWPSGCCCGCPRGRSRWRAGGWRWRPCATGGRGAASPGAGWP